MLVLRRKSGDWVEITHKSGDLIRVRVYNFREGSPPQADLVFDDAARNFQVERPERAAKGTQAPAGGGPPLNPA